MANCDMAVMMLLAVVAPFVVWGLCVTVIMLLELCRFVAGLLLARGRTKPRPRDESVDLPAPLPVVLVHAK